MSPPRKKVKEEEVKKIATGHPNFGVIRFEIDNFSTLDVIGRLSREIEVGGVPWIAIVYKIMTSDKPQLFVGLKSMSNSSPLWRIVVDYMLIIVNADSNKSIFRVMDPATFNHANTGWGKSLDNWDDLIEVEGFINDDKLTVEIHFSITSMKGLRTTARIDFSDPNEPRHDVTLVIGGEKIYVSKQLLALHSPVFNTMFYSDNFAEKDKKEIELKDVDRKEFIEMLHVIYPNGKKITDDNVLFLLKLGDRFEIKFLFDLCEECLVSSTILLLHSKLLLSDKYRLTKLQGHCLDQINTMEDVKDLKKTPEYNELSPETKVAVYEKIVQE